MKPEPKFVPGELALVVHSIRRPDTIGRVVKVAAIKWARDIAGSGYGWFYADGDLVPVANLDMGCGTPAFMECQLAKLPPDTPATFDAAIWQPNEVTA